MRLVDLFEDARVESAKEAAQLIVRDCRPYLSEGTYYTNPLYRGIHDHEWFLHRSVRKDRRPLDMLNGLHLAIDQWFLDRFGHRFRSNATFARGREIGLAQYGNIYVIFPVGEFKICWSPNVTDLYVTRASILSSIMRKRYAASYPYAEWSMDVVTDELKKANSFDELDDTTKEGVYEFMDNQEYTKGYLRRALKSGNEIMIACDSYYAVEKDRDQHIDVATQIKKLLEAK